MRYRNTVDNPAVRRGPTISDRLLPFSAGFFIAAMTFLALCKIFG